MNPIALLLIPIYFASYYPGSYAVLVMTGVEYYRSKRALQFGGMIAALQVFPPLLLGIAAGEFGILLGSALGLVISFKYVASVLSISWAKNIAIIIFLPMVSSILAGVAYLLLFGVMG